ncbi:hydroxyacylglutathione hydrolase [Shewanella sp. WXL01]|uniref:hydroxyacylglutathione hydrolase n=1 Tax=Shewanella sp. WXL01 TaxID=2709721 RepID=UPI00143838A6|nr:hydroxyacylglutathione hydrolase [Shewanella sp. WXL01]NKF52595.1 hydroxyacylglutathione hydrolase [Shewanella sp. WXL01]
MLNIHAINAFNDNYIWLIEHKNIACVVDPGCASSVLNFLEVHPHITLGAILITHHHADHTGGINELQQAFAEKLQVYGPQNQIAGINHQLTPTTKLERAQTLSIEPLGITAKVLATPGHTLDHLCYVIEDNLFCGDTLFSGGCGRLFEGTATQMHHSLSELAKLDDSTKVYCAHEYTLANLAFAKAIEPNNDDLMAYAKQAVTRRDNQLATIPTNIGLEKSINPFLRAHCETIWQHLQKEYSLTVNDPLQAFTSIRKLKDEF